jgi:hypothetical protein
MGLIRSVEINYFRSIYRARLSNLRDLNVLSGRNDAGKSTVLKALNLFFNNRTDWQAPLNFYRDFSLSRLNQVRQESVKGRQFISITVEFERPETYSGSLPAVFRVTRTWYRDGSAYGEYNNIDSLYKAGRLPSSPDTARRFLAILLNRIHYEYIPAVKDRFYHEHLLTRLQSALLDIPTGADSTIAQTASNLASHIQEKIVQLQQDFERATGIASSVVPPMELSALFQSFVVSTDSGGHKIPLTLRGDGIQARYVPSVLRYIAQTSKNFFIWGFEEPENSLEYSYAADMAADFSTVYTKIAQIFLTTHCPAFTAIRSDTNTCFRVAKKDAISAVEPLWPKKGTADLAAQLNIEMGFLRVQEKLHQEYLAQTTQLKVLEASLNEAVEAAIAASKPLVLTEGKYDKAILEVAWSKLYTKIACPFVVRPADTSGDMTPGGAAGADMLRKMIEAFHPADGRHALALFDRDEHGIRVFKALDKNFKRVPEPTDRAIHVNGVASALLLPIPPGREAYAVNENIPIEYLFPDEYLDVKTTTGKGLVLAEPELVVRAGSRRLEVDTNTLTLDLKPLRTIVGGKDVFAEQIVPALPADAFKAFNPLFEAIRALLDI